MAKEQFRRDREDSPAKTVSKADAIRASKMPEKQKEQCLRDIGEIKTEETFDPSKVTFQVYAQVRGVPKDRRQAMLVFPKASGVKLATLNEWDEIYKNF